MHAPHALLIALLAVCSLTTACGAEPDGSTPVGSASIVGTWRFPSRSINERDMTYVFVGDAASGTFTYTNINLGGVGGCVSESSWAGRWMLAGASLTLASTAGSSTVRGCTDPRDNVARSPLSPADLRALDATTPITLTATTLTFPASVVDPAITYTRQ